MLQISAQMLAMSSEYAVIEKNGKIVYANSGAQSLLGSNCEGRSIAAVLGEELAGIQAPSFIGNFSIGGNHHIVRACTIDGMRVFFFSESEDKPELLNEAFLFSLRSCLMNLNVSISLLHSRDDISPELAEQLSHLCHESFKISRTISNLSTIHSLSEKSLVMTPMQMDVSAHIRDIVDSTRILAPQIDFSFSAPGPIMLNTDPSLLDILTLNLISNCISHGKGLSRINVVLSRIKDKMILRVDDNGCGVASHRLHNVFDCYRHKSAMGELDNGTGLGLTAARLIASAHGGTILLESRENQGTSVCVSLGDINRSYASLGQSNSVYEKSMSTLLTGLANCLPSELYTEKYID